MATLGGKTFVAPASAAVGTEQVGIATAKKGKSFVEPGPAGKATDNSREQQLLRTRTAASSFSSPKGDFEWGKRLFRAGLEFDVCRNDKMRMGWLTAAKG